jgi:alanine racemase
MARLSLQAIAHNLAMARKRAPNAKIYAVLKANAYGHGLLRVLPALEKADGFCVLTLEEALLLREKSNKPIVLLEGVYRESDWQLCSKYRLATVIHQKEQLHVLLKTPLATPLTVFLKINTGMNRLGFSVDEVSTIVAILQKAGQHVVLMTHFASADEENGIENQFAIFNETVIKLRLPTSCANSAALFKHPRTHGDIVRAGIMLYGVSPFADQTGIDLGLKPALSLISAIVAIHDIAKGERVGYGGEFVAPHDMRIGIVAAGYADGYVRASPTGTPIMVDHQKTRIIGRISMDKMAVDLTPVPSAKLFSPVVLWGEALPVEEVARAAGTIAYELLAGLSPRVPVIVDG